MVQTVQCPQCGANHSPDDSPEGLCPKRLLAIAMGGDQADATLEGSEDASNSSEIGRQAMDRLLGQVLDGKYRLDQKLGQGGMGAVYKATHLGTGRPVALKVIAPQFMHNEEFVERFKREAKAAGLLRHPNVVNVTDFGFASAGSDRLAYLVMEFLDGFTLGHMLRRKGKLGLEFVVDIVEQTALAIDEAHKQGIIHRDLKPDNIWLEPNGRGGYNVKVLDFGLAKLRESSPSGKQTLMGISGQYSVSAVTAIQPQEADQDAPKEIRPAAGEKRTLAEEEKTQAANRGATAGAIDPRTAPEWLTRAGVVLGTPLYMSPEQCHGESLDARSDIYSLGIIVYEMLAGETPFAGDLYRLIAKHSEMPPPPLKQKRRDIPKSAAAVVMSALAKNPAERPPTATAFAAALRASIEGETPMLRQALDLYRKHFSPFVLISSLAYLPFIVLYILILVAAGLEDTLLLADKLLKGYGLFFLPIVLFANSVNNAAFVRVVEQLRMSPQSRVKIRPILAALYKKMGTLATTGIRCNLIVFSRLLKLIIPGVRTYIDNSLFAPVVIMEGLQGQAALLRSKALVNRMRPLAISIQVRDLFVGFITLFAFPLMFVVLRLLADLSINYIVGMASQDVGTLLLLPLCIMVIFLPWIFLILVHPMIAAGFAILYFKMRQAGGEMLNESFDNDSEQLEMIGRNKMSYLRPAALLLILLVVSIGWIATKEAVLSFAVSNRFQETVKVLIRAGADVNSTDQGWTPLTIAASNGDTQMISLLLENGADANTANNSDIDYMPYGTPLMAAASSECSFCVVQLVSKGADVNAKSKNGRTSLMHAPLRKDLEIMKFLVEKGADVNAKTNNGKTVLMFTSQWSALDAIRFLIEKGADVNARDRDGKTALKYAMENGRTDSAELLKAAGAEQ